MMTMMMCLPQARVFGLRAVEASRQGKEADAFAELPPLPRPANAANKHLSREAAMLKRRLNNKYPSIISTYMFQIMQTCHRCSYQQMQMPKNTGCSPGCSSGLLAVRPSLYYEVLYLRLLAGRGEASFVFVRRNRKVGSGKMGILRISLVECYII